MQRESGAPETSETEVTPAMIEAGADVIYGYFCDAVPPGSALARDAAKAVFLAMRSREASGRKAASRIDSVRPVNEREAALRRLLSDRGGYIFLIAEDLPAADLRSHTE